jgi:predicted nucleic acid-binding protein
MREAVVDASVAIKWFVPEVHSDSALRWLDSDLSISAPDLIVAELGNTVWKKLRRGEITRDNAAEILSGFNKLDLALAPSTTLISVAFGLAAELDRTVYDSLYLALAITRGWTLITADRKFYSATKASSFAASIVWVADEP